MMGFIDQMRSEGFAVESIIRVLREQGVKIAARTYRAWKRGRVAVRTVTDAIVVDAVRDAAWRDETLPGGSTRRKMTPEGLYGRKKMTAFIRRTTLRDVSRGAVDRAMRALGLSGVTRAKAIRTTIPAKDGVRAGNLLNRDFTAPRPDHTWVTDFTYVRTWAGWVYVAFILDVFSQRIVAWHAQTSKHTDLVMIPLRMALWRRDRDGHPVGPGQLRHHSDAGSGWVTPIRRLSARFRCAGWRSWKAGAAQSLSLGRSTWPWVRVQPTLGRRRTRMSRRQCAPADRKSCDGCGGARKEPL